MFRKSDRKATNRQGYLSGFGRVHSIVPVSADERTDVAKPGKAILFGLSSGFKNFSDVAP